MEHRLMYSPQKKVVLVHIQTPPKNYGRSDAKESNYEAQAFDESNSLIASVTSTKSAIEARQLLMIDLKKLGYSYR